jgi:hypothetical protein
VRRAVDPEDVYTLSPAHDVQVRWARSGDPTRFDAVLRRTLTRVSHAWPFDLPEHGDAPAAYANVPARHAGDGDLSILLRQHIRESLPEYMVPSMFVVMKSLPLTLNGKIDRNALPDPVRDARAAAASFAHPAGTIERQLAEIWEDILGVDRIGRRDNIFDLGANSLLTMQANTRVSARLGRRVSLVSMFRYPTIESLAAHLGSASAPIAASATEKRARDRASQREQAAERRRALRAARQGDER